MFEKIRRLFIIKTKFEVYLITYALALGACERGKLYLDQYPGYGGWLLFVACTGAVKGREADVRASSNFKFSSQNILSIAKEYSI